MVGRPHQPHDQGARHSGRAGGPRAVGGRGHHPQRHPALLRIASTRSPATPCGAERSGGSRSTGSSQSTASSSAASTSTRRSTFPNCRPPRRGKSASSTPNGSGRRIRNSGRTRSCHCSKSSSSPARGQRISRSAGQVRRRLRRFGHPDQSAGHQRGRAGDDRQDVHAAGRSAAPAGRARRRSTRRSISRSSKSADGRRDEEIRRSAQEASWR